jgi:hypothetical protein
MFKLILTPLTATSHLKIPYNKVMKIQVLSCDRHKNLMELNQTNLFIIDNLQL